jgi:hypothetical protein
VVRKHLHGPCKHREGAERTIKRLCEPVRASDAFGWYHLTVDVAAILRVLFGSIWKSRGSNGVLLCCGLAKLPLYCCGLRLGLFGNGGRSDERDILVVGGATGHRMSMG